jgi:hypothetical protein
VPGPTIEALEGTLTHVTWLNYLPSHHFLPWDPTIPTAMPSSGVPTVPHLHGGVQPPALDGNSLAWFTASFAFRGPLFLSPVYYCPKFPTSWQPLVTYLCSPYYNQHLKFRLKFVFILFLFCLFSINRYHDHALGLTRVNILSGMIGTYQITSPRLEDPLGLPSGPEYDRHLVIFDHEFRVDGSIYMNSTGNVATIHLQWWPEYFGPAIIVNGKA